MRTASRVALTTVVVLSTWYFVFWSPLCVIPSEDFWLRGLVAIVCAAVAGGFVWSRSSARERKTSIVSSVAYGAIVVGSIGFAVGFFGPILWAPDANQGPLLGIFITGPSGVVAGAVGGLVHGIGKRRRQALAGDS